MPALPQRSVFKFFWLKKRFGLNFMSTEMQATIVVWSTFSLAACRFAKAGGVMCSKLTERSARSVGIDGMQMPGFRGKLEFVRNASDLAVIGPNKTPYADAFTLKMAG
jgi:hypothetical protein